MRAIPMRAVLAAVRELLAGGAAPSARGALTPGLVDCAGPRPAAQAEERPA
jgi:hypothetical protein